MTANDRKPPTLAETRTGTDWCSRCEEEAGTNRYTMTQHECCGTCGAPLCPTPPIRVGDLVEFGDDGGVLGRVTAVVARGRVVVEFPNGTADLPAADLVVVRRGVSGP